MYKFEIHLHTNNCSACAISSPEEMVDIAAEKGYSGIVITNHFYYGNTCVDRKLPWEEFVDAYKKDYKIAKNYGKKKGITVFFGLEDCYARGKEMLIYGLGPEHFSAHPEFNTMSPKEKSDFVHSFGGLCVCAHPFRDRSYIPDPDVPPNPDLFDGVEGFNLCNHPEENKKAFEYALKHKKFIISGSDTHSVNNFGDAGIYFDTPVTNYKTFIKKMKNGEFGLIYPK